MLVSCDGRALVTYCLYIAVFCGSKTEARYDELYPINGDLQFHQRMVGDPQQTGTSRNLSCEKPSFYMCEEPWYVLPPQSENEKFCNFRNWEYPEQIYRWVAGWACLGYTHDHLFVAGYNNVDMNSRCHFGDQRLPCLEIAKENGVCGCFPFDPAFEKVVSTINAAMVPNAQGRWERCYNEAEDCCSNVMGLENVYIVGPYCPATFDGWTCWQPAEANTVSSEVCTEFAYSDTGPSCHRLKHQEVNYEGKIKRLENPNAKAIQAGNLKTKPYDYSTKSCYSNETWEIQTDYSSCSISPRLVQRYQYHIGVLAFSIAACLPAVFVFFFYKRLRVTRVILHRNLLIAIILRNVAVIISRAEIYIDVLTNSTDSVISNHTVACRVLAIFERIAANAVFVCMLIEGVYLHRMIVAVFKRKLNTKVLYGVGAVITIAPVIAWSIVMSVLNDHSCWVVYTVSQIQWILDAPRIVILLINTGLFIDILRVLLTTKMKNADSTNQLNTTKATLFLMPLFGSQFLLTAFRPNTTVCTNEEIYYYITYTVEGLQGFIVAMLYCYVNKEVHNLVKSTYKKTESAVVSRVRKNSIYPRPVLEPSAVRRMTYSTYCEEEPKIRTAEIITLEPEENYAEVIEAVPIAQARYVSSDKGSSEEAETDSGIVPNISGEDFNKYTNQLNNEIPKDGLQNSKTMTFENQPKNNGNETNGKQSRNNAYATDEYKNENDNNVFETDENENQPETHDESTSDQTFEDFRNSNLDSDAEYIQTVSEIEDPEFFDDVACIQIYSSDNTDEYVDFDPDVLSPNRKSEDKIIFVD